MAEIPRIKVIFDRRRKASAVTPGSVEIEMSYNRERVRLSTGVADLKQQWSVMEVVNHPEADIGPTSRSAASMTACTIKWRPSPQRRESMTFLLSKR